MTKHELEEIIQELLDSPEIFRQGIKVYNSLPDADPNKKILAKAIQDAKAEAIKLDVYLEDMLWEMESEKIRALLG
tara:strand:- start:3560 stop:3787 length:228 start_codon:yes stop_codon:yes gene_type:complete